MKNKKQKKTVKVIIKPYDKSLIGKQIVTTHGLVTITNVTKERVIYEDDNGNENWTWIYPNKRWASFDVVSNEKALTVAQGYRVLQQRYDDLACKYNQLVRMLEELTYFKKENYNASESDKS